MDGVCKPCRAGREACGDTTYGQHNCCLPGECKESGRCDCIDPLTGRPTGEPCGTKCCVNRQICADATTGRCEDNPCVVNSAAGGTAASDICCEEGYEECGGECHLTVNGPWIPCGDTCCSSVSEFSECCDGVCRSKEEGPYTPCAGASYPYCCSSAEECCDGMCYSTKYYPGPYTPCGGGNYSCCNGDSECCDGQCYLSSMGPIRPAPSNAPYGCCSSDAECCPDGCIPKWIGGCEA